MRTGGPATGIQVQGAFSLRCLMSAQALSIPLPVPPPSIMRSIYALCLGACLLAGQASAFVSPAARGAVSLGRAAAHVAPVASRRSERSSGMVMQSSLESSVSLYKKCVGDKRWETDEGIEKRAAVTFADMCKVYGEDNAMQMVRFWWRLSFVLISGEGS